MDAYWRVAVPVSRQIYLYDNHYSRVPHKGSSKRAAPGPLRNDPGLNFIYVHLNRLIKQHDLDMIYITGRGGGPGLG